MKREVLTAMGLEEEVIEKIMAEHGKDVNASKAKVAELEEQVSALKGQISERDKQLKDLNKSVGDNETLKEQISKLQEDNKKSTEAYEARIAQMGIDNAVTLALTNAGAKNVKAARALLNLDGAKMDGETVVGLADQIAKAKESEPYMFNDAKPTVTGAKPAEGSGTPAPTAKEGSYQAFIAKHYPHLIES